MTRPLLETAPAFAGMGGHHSARSTTDVWLTPPAVIQALGGAESFDLDPCFTPPRPWSTAQHHYGETENGLLQRWFGRVFLNPPYSRALLRAFMGRMVEHGRGVALVFARTDTQIWHRLIWERADAVLFLEGRLTFCTPDGAPATKRNGHDANGGAPSALIAYGRDDADLLADFAMPGAFVPLRLSRGVLALALPTTWRDVVAAALEAEGGPVSLSKLYVALRDHHKARGRAHYQAKIRQVLQQGAGRKIAPGIWSAA
ncbi:MAG: phage N-6-adenine-methyltransferase [Alphaproteobacteria bacterium]|nr:phage N-6-adenine-methyltransferase [Alphaproteobacteria bacterium]